MAFAHLEAGGVSNFDKVEDKMTYRPTLFKSIMGTLLVYYSSQSQRS
jgi:hypothetical protein